MRTVVAVVEGETEQAFIREVLATHLESFDVALHAILPGKPHKRHGGVRSYQAVRGDLLRALKSDRRAACTTMFDY